MDTRGEIIAKLDLERERLLEHYRSLSPEELNRQCTQSEAPDGAPWTAKDHVAHLAMIERAFQGMVRRTLEGTSNPLGIDFKGKNREAAIAMVHEGNQKNVDAHRDDDLETLLADLDVARAETRRLLNTLTDEQLATPIPGAPWADGTIGGVLGTNAHHEIQHWTWVEEGLSK
jgi:DinB family protein